METAGKHSEESECINVHIKFTLKGEHPEMVQRTNTKMSTKTDAKISFTMEKSLCCCFLVLVFPIKLVLGCEVDHELTHLLSKTWNSVQSLDLHKDGKREPTL